MTGYGMTLGSVLPRGTAGSARQANWLAGPSAVNVSADRGCYLSVRGHDPVPPVAARGNLASVYREAGRTAEAIPLLEQNLADREQLLGIDHPDTLMVRGSLASAYQDAGRIREATATLDQNLADHERVLGSDHPTHWPFVQTNECLPGGRSYGRD
jgi:hypothetical protein